MPFRAIRPAAKPSSAIAIEHEAAGCRSGCASNVGVEDGPGGEHAGQMVGDLLGHDPMAALDADI